MSRHQSTIQQVANTNRIIPTKPKRPLTVFNLFSILERNFIVQQNQKRASVPSNVLTINTDPYLATRPERYRDVVLPSNWYVVGMNRVKRSKHKVHGVISFHDLTKEISLRWKAVDAETKHYCEIIAADELMRYRRDMAAYEATYGKIVVDAQKQSRKKRSKDNNVRNNNAQCNGNLDIKDNQGQATCQIDSITCTAADKYVTTNTACSRDHSPTLSDYLPDDQEAALALVGNNYDNILHGEELEKAFDSD
ncbi:hypothetical protein ACHAWX_003514 [Stephanocyclus meneghinianus]